MEHQHMPAEGKLKNGDLLLVIALVGRVLHIQAHLLLFSFSNPELVHVEDSLHLGGVVGVGRLDGLLAVDIDGQSLAEVLSVIHGDYAWKKKKRVEKTRHQRRRGKHGNISVEGVEVVTLCRVGTFTTINSTYHSLPSGPKLCGRIVPSKPSLYAYPP